MLTLLAVLSLAHAAPTKPAAASAPASASTQERTACDGLGFVERLACIKENYPKIHARVEGLCSAKEAAERRACREKEYGAYGISWGKDGADEGTASAARGGGRTADSSADASSRSRSAGSTSATGSSSGASGSRSGAASSAAATTTSASPASGASPTTASATTSSGASGDTSSAGGSRSSSSGTSSSSSALSASSLQDVVLNPTAVSVATVSLTLAGTAMQQAPSLCANSKGCGLSKKDQSALSTYGGILASQAATLPGILGSGASDGDKAAQVLTVLADMAAKAPTGLGGKAQGYVDAALTAIADVRAAAGG